MSRDALRIALLTHSVNPRGGVVHALELASALHLAGSDVTVFAPAAPGEAMFRDVPCRVVLARVDGRPRGVAEMVSARIAAIRRALLEHDAGGFDVLHAQDSISGNALAELKQSGAIDGFVRTVHHLDVFDDPQLERWQERAWREADQVLCVSAAWAVTMREKFGIDASVVPNGVDVARFARADHGDMQAVRQRFGLGSGPVVLAVGGIEQRKNSIALLEAFARLRSTLPGARLVIGGGASLLDHDAYARRFVARAAALGLGIGVDEPVVTTGPLDDAALVALMHCADVVSMVSIREGFGLVVLEGLACGKPVVVSEIEPFTEYLDEHACVWADPADVDSIADALRDALSGRRAPDFAHAVPALLNRFTWEASARKHLDIYLDRLAQRAQASSAE
ncbi:MSMEG_0565 family glycosyltransferase [Burkholderia cepacia]|uniref:MSMEG_0565 family glycosyltransferase n=1 Tax=Burkholderia cepacia TaxID=292 RepID=A0A2S8IUH0_BURCE|nr:MSMEG_0565 family glycosyltransferase [Burkholderia cepacia]PQP18418.1 MSMEG_0565 family glycosyltransferase [Burkholderia cepacia]HDR9507381.1 MSMEG_0565 family glycosyltransferase [Burkholderia cepacia]